MWIKDPKIHDLGLVIYLKIFIGPLLDHGLKRGTPGRAASVFAFLFVCLSVNKLQVTIFNPAT